jgi:hypothetical protein
MCPVVPSVYYWFYIPSRTLHLVPLMSVPCAVLQGRHIVKDALTACPNCDFPAILPELQLWVLIFTKQLIYLHFSRLETIYTKHCRLFCMCVQ